MINVANAIYDSMVVKQTLSPVRFRNEYNVSLENPTKNDCSLNVFTSKCLQTSKIAVFYHTYFIF